MLARLKPAPRCAALRAASDTAIRQCSWFAPLVLPHCKSHVLMPQRQISALATALTFPPLTTVNERLGMHLGHETADLVRLPIQIRGQPIHIGEIGGIVGRYYVQLR